MWIKYSFPRIRIDHLLAFNWKFLTPLALVVLMVTAIADKVLVGENYFNLAKYSPGYVIGMLIVNLVIAWGTIALLRSYARIERQRVAEPRPSASPDLAELPKAG